MLGRFTTAYQFIRKVWYQRIEPPASLKEAGIRSRSRFLGAIVLILIPMVISLSVIGLLLSGHEPDVFNDLYSHLFGLGALLIIHILNRKGWYRAAAGVLIFITIFIVFWGAMPFDDPADADFLVYLAIPILMTYLLLSSRAAFLVALSCLIGMLSLPLFVPSLSFWALLYFQGTFMIVVLLLSWLVNRHRVYEERNRQIELRHNEKRLRLITDNMQEIIFYFDADGILQYLSPSIETVLGYNSQEASKSWRFWFDVIHPDDLAITLENIQRAVSASHPTHYEYRIFHRDGRLIWLEIASTPLKKEEGGGVVFTCRDITERKIMQDKLYTNEREQRQMAESMRDMVVILNSSLKLEEVLAHVLEQAKIIIPHDAAWIGLVDSGAVYTIRSHGYTERGLSNDQHLQYPLDKLTNLRKIIETNQSIIIENTETDDHWVMLPELSWVKSSMGAPIYVGNQVVGVINLDSQSPYAFSQRDTEPLKALARQASAAIHNALLFENVERQAYELEQHVADRTLKLNHAQKRAETILEHNLDAIILLHENGTISQVNPAFSTQFGYGVDELVHQSVSQLIRPDGRQSFNDALAKLHNGEATQRLELSVQRKDGTTFWADAALTLIPDPVARQMIVCSLHDITPLKQVEDGLRRALEKERDLNELKSIFVTTVSHEFRTPLAIIQSSSDLLKHYGERLSGGRKTEHLDKIQKQVSHMTHMLQDILAYTHEQADEHADIPKESEQR